jgi:hypothetical protein
VPTAGVASSTRNDRRPDVAAAGLAVVLVLAAGVAGWWLNGHGQRVWAGAPPLYGTWRVRVGPGTPLAAGIALLVLGYGPPLAARLPWRRLLGLAYACAAAWSLGLGLVDGWRRGLATRLVTEHEYLSEVDGVRDVGAMLRGFTDRILDYQPDSWATHVAGHPPGALLVFVALDRIGLSGGGWAAALCVLAGATTAVSVPVALRALGAPDAARAAVPFLVLFPGAVWFGASADAVFAAVTTAGVALLAIASTVTSRRGDALATGAGVALGAGVFLSYGLVLMGLIALAVTVVAGRVRPLVLAACGAAGVVLAYAAAGFWWLDGYHLVVARYGQSVARLRSYGYWVWANLACLVLSAGPATAPMLRRAAVSRGRSPAVLLPLAAGLAMLAADLSGLSKAEVERIWLPFAVWLPAAAGLLPGPDRRGWLAAQAVTALAVNHLVFTNW